MKKVSLFTILMASSILSAQAMQGDLEKAGNAPTTLRAAPQSKCQSDTNEYKPSHRLREYIQLALKLTTARLLEHNESDPRVIIVGDSGAGKSTLLNYLAKQELEGTDDFKLDAKKPLKGSEIGHEKTSKTRLPSAWVAPDKTIFWDSAGDEDTKGPEQEIINLYARGQLLKGNVKVLLAVSETSLAERSNDFLRQLKQLTETLPGADLRQSLALVITKKGLVRGINPLRELTKILQTNTDESIHLMTNPVRSLLQHLVDNNGSHISYFPCPQEPGIYEDEKAREQIFESVCALTPMVNPTVRLQLPAESQQVVLHLAGDLSRTIEGSLSPKIKSGALTSFINNLRDLDNPASRERIATHLRALESIQATLDVSTGETIGDFASHLSSFMEPGELEQLKENLKELGFLATLNPDVDLNTCRTTWSNDAKGTLDLINNTIKIKVKAIVTGISQELEAITRKIMQECTNIINVHDDENTRISFIEGHKRNVLAALQSLNEDLRAFATPFNRYFSDLSINPLSKFLDTLIFFQSIKSDLQVLKRDWISVLQQTEEYISGLIRVQERTKVTREQLTSQISNLTEGLVQSHRVQAAFQETILALTVEREGLFVRLADLERQHARDEEAIVAVRREIARIDQEHIRLEQELNERVDRLDQQHVDSTALMTSDRQGRDLLRNDLGDALVRLRHIETGLQRAPVVPAPGGPVKNSKSAPKTTVKKGNVSQTPVKTVPAKTTPANTAPGKIVRHKGLAKHFAAKRK